MKNCKYQQIFDNNLQSNTLRIELGWNIERIRCGCQLKDNHIGGHPLDYEPCSPKCKYSGLNKKSEEMFQNHLLNVIEKETEFLKEELVRRQIVSNSPNTKRLKQLIEKRRKDINAHFWTIKNIIPKL